MKKANGFGKRSTKAMDTQNTIRQSIRVYKVTDTGRVEHCTHNSFLDMLEETAGFDTEKFFAKFTQEDGSLKPGYYFIDHYTKRGNFFDKSFAELVEYLNKNYPVGG